MIRKVSIEELNKAVAKWKSDMLEDGVMMYAEDKEMWIALDNLTGDCWVKKFDTETEALRWLNMQ